MENPVSVLIFMAFTLGLRHGLDLDHIATIDAITRTINRSRVQSRIIGILFALGHGTVVTCVSVIIGGGMISSHIPGWLENTGNCISIFFLFLFGSITLLNVIRQPGRQPVPAAIKSLLADRILTQNNHPGMIILTGALFAFSFDTFSQVALFSMSASLLAGWAFSGVLGIVFMLGMMTSDGVNGLIVSALVRRADQTSILISRAAGLIIAVFSLSVATMNWVMLCMN